MVKEKGKEYEGGHITKKTLMPKITSLGIWFLLSFLEGPAQKETWIMSHSVNFMKTKQFALFF